MRIFDKYYNVLNLPVGADQAQIKASYRQLAKIFHPDKSRDPGTREKFIEVNEAYEILMRRDEYVRDAILRYKQKQAHQHRYGTSQGGMNGARERAEGYAKMRFNEFEKSPIYKTALVVNSAASYIFVFLGFLMIVSPILGYYFDVEIATLESREPEFHFFPIVIGIAFLYGIWYFLFKQNEV